MRAGVFFLLLIRFREHCLYHPCYRVHSFFPPRLRIDFERDAARAAGMTHVVARNFKAPAHATHQARVHGAEAAEIDACRQSEFLDDRLQMAMQQVVTIERLPLLISEHEILRLAEFLIALPHDLQSAKHPAMTIKRKLALAGLGLYVVEFVVVHTLVNDEAIRQAILPTQRETSPGLIEAKTIKIRRERVGSGTASSTRRISTSGSSNGGLTERFLGSSKGHPFLPAGSLLLPMLRTPIPEMFNCAQT